MAAATRHSWHAAFQQAVEFDAWGQVEEAVASYQRLQVATALEALENKLRLQGSRRAAIASLAAALALRMKELSGGPASASAAGIGLGGMQALRPFVAGLIVSDVPLPPAVAAALKSAAAPHSAGGAGELLYGVQQRASDTHEDAVATIIHQQASEELPSTEPSPARRPPQQGSLGHGAQAAAAAGAAAGSLRPALQQVDAGDVTLSINLGSWSAKGAADMAAPHVLITVRDGVGELLEAVQESPHARGSRCGDPDKLDLGFTWHLQTPLNCLPEDAAVFFELRHWKAARKKWSVRCYACMPLSGAGVAPGAAMLELWRKPAQYKRGRRPAFTSKPHFLHIMRALEQH